MRSRPIAIRLTNGFGNNLFQYIHGRIVSGDDHLAVRPPSKDYYALKDLKKVGLGFKVIKDIKNYNEIAGYHEDYTFYRQYLPLIKTWFRPINTLNKGNLVLHMRLTDRLLYKNSYEAGMHVMPDRFSEAIKKFDYSQLFIVTDMPLWRHVSEDELDGMQFHVQVPDKIRVKTKVAANYMNALVDELKPFNPIVNYSKGSIADHFNFIRSFDQILLQHSTMAWWAAALSGASKVGVYGPWRPAKGKNNKNLGRTDYPGWFGWE